MLTNLNKNSIFKESLYNTDKYQYTMAAIHSKSGKSNSWATFNFFTRKAPDGNGWFVVSGVNEVLELIKIINSYDYTRTERRKFFTKLFGDNLDVKFMEELVSMRFTGNIHAMMEGEIAFPNEPVITLEGPLNEVQILETPILSIMNHQCNVATKASRVYRAAHGRTISYRDGKEIESEVKEIPVSSFGSRRAHGPWASIYGDKAAYIGGCANGSNLMTEYLTGVPSTGTMAHAFIEAYTPAGKEGEYKAFHDFVKYNDVTVNILLIDTYDILNCGIKNAIKVFKEFDLENKKGVYGIRLDSGDLSYLSKECRRLLDEAGLYHAKIFLTNGLDEYLIKDLFEQGVAVDGFGCGDAIATSKDNPCFGGVYKLAEIDGQPTMKMSNDIVKIINPGFHEVFRICSNKNGEFLADLMVREEDFDRERLLRGDEITITDEHDEFKKTTFPAGSYTAKRLFHEAVIDGEVQDDFKNFTAANAREFFLDNLSHLSKECKRLVNPHIYKVDLSDDLRILKLSTIENIKNNF